MTALTSDQLAAKLRAAQEADRARQTAQVHACVCTVVHVLRRPGEDPETPIVNLQDSPYVAALTVARALRERPGETVDISLTRSADGSVEIHLPERDALPELGSTAGD